jgi:L-seryl-tRNA(Ser) seleniumtransferase
MGAGIVEQPVVLAVQDVLGRAVEMAELQEIASSVISRAFDCEAGGVLGCTAAGISLACAAAMTGTDSARVAQLPDTTGMKNRIVLQKAHDCWFGAYVGQMIRLSGAKLDYVGSSNGTTEDDLERALTADTAAAMFVASHHVPSDGMIPLERFIATCKRAGVPVIIDAAGTVDVRLYVEAGASLILASAHKNFGGLTAGIVAGSKALVDACLLQERGIGRAMKVGKEGIAGVIAGLSEWMRVPQADRELQWKDRAQRMCEYLAGAPGLAAELETDLPEGRIHRARVRVDEQRTGMTAHKLAEQLRLGDPSIRVWEAGLKRGFFELDPRCLSDVEAGEVCNRILSMVNGVNKGFSIRSERNVG